MTVDLESQNMDDIPRADRRVAGPFYFCKIQVFWLTIKLTTKRKRRLFPPLRRMSFRGPVFTMAKSTSQLFLSFWRVNRNPHQSLLLRRYMSLMPLRSCIISFRRSVTSVLETAAIRRCGYIQSATSETLSWRLQTASI